MSRTPEEIFKSRTAVLFSRWVAATALMLCAFMTALAQGVRSPDGNLVVKLTLTNDASTLSLLHDPPDRTTGSKSATVGSDGIIHPTLEPGGGAVLFQ